MKQLLQEELAAAQAEQENAVAAVKAEAESSNVELQNHLRHVQSQHR